MSGRMGMEMNMQGGNNRDDGTFMTGINVDHQQQQQHPPSMSNEELMYVEEWGVVVSYTLNYDCTFMCMYPHSAALHPSVRVTFHLALWLSQSWA